MPDTEPLDLTAWLPAHFAAKWRDHPREMSLAVVVPAGPAVVAVNPPLFAQAVDNVVDNSFKHGGHGVAVAVTVSVRGGDIVLTVDDTGPGIPESERAAVFGRAGSGLAVAARIVRSFGGKVSALPHRGGARVAIVLPMACG